MQGVSIILIFCILLCVTISSINKGRQHNKGTFVVLSALVYTTHYFMMDCVGCSVFPLLCFTKWHADVDS
jgi:hypothetical protein